MEFINPIEVLNLSKIPVAKIDSSVLRKAKKSILAEIELSEDGYILLENLKISKFQIEKAAEDLADFRKLQYYHQIANDKNLNDFLTFRRCDFFIFSKNMDIYSSPEFIDLISPIFAERYNWILVEAYQSKDLDQFKAIISHPPLINKFDEDSAFRGLRNALQNSIQEVIALQERFLQNDLSLYDISKLNERIQKILPSAFFNLLPNSFYTIQRQAVKSIRNFSVSVYNESEDSEAALEIIRYAFKFRTDDTTAQELTTDYRKIESIAKKALIEKQQESIYTKYNRFFHEASVQLKSIEAKLSSPNYIVVWLRQNVPITEINQLDKEFDEIRETVAILLRTFAIAIWNNFYAIDTSIEIIEMACLVSGLPEETQKDVSNIRTELLALKRKPSSLTTKGNTQQVPVNLSKVYDTEKNSSSSSAFLFIILLAILIISVVAISKSREDHNSYVSNPPYSDSTSNNTTQNLARQPPIRDRHSRYHKNHLRNGASPYSNCFGKGQYGGRAHVTFDNSNESDAIVCLVNTFTGRVVRNSYIREGMKYTVKNIPSGTYALKVYYGSDWNPNMKNFCGGFGGFENNVSYMRSDDPIEIHNTDISYTTGSITLYPVTNGNMSTQSVTEDDFFSNN